MNQDELKALVGRAALSYVVPGSVVGVGTRAGGFGRLARLGALNLDYGPETKAMPPRFVLRLDQEEMKLDARDVIAWVEKGRGARKLSAGQAPARRAVTAPESPSTTARPPCRCPGRPAPPTPQPRTRLRWRPTRTRPAGCWRR